MATATYKIPVGSAVAPVTRAGPPAYAGAAFVNVTGTNRDYGYWRFDPDSNQGIMLECPVSDAYAGGARQVRLRWRSATTTGNVVWVAEHEPTGAGEQFDEAFSGSNTTTTATSGVANQTVDTIITLSAAAWTAGDTAFFHIYRNAVDAGDTLNDYAELLEVDILQEVPGGGGGTDTFTVPNEYYVNPGLAADATVRQYQTIAAALAAGITAAVSPIIIRLADGVSHSWDGSQLSNAGAAALDVQIYAEAPSGNKTLLAANTTLALTAAISLSSDEGLTLHNLRITQAGALSVGVDRLLVSKCSGSFVFSSIDIPTPDPGKDVVFQECDFEDWGVIGVVGETAGGDMLISNCILAATNQDLWDHSAATSNWTIIIESSTIKSFSNDLFTQAGVDLSIEIRDTLLVLYAGAGLITIVSGGNGPNWESCRIIEGIVDKTGSGFTFGAAGLAAGLEIEYHEGTLLPTDAPNGTTARSPNSPSNIPGQVVFDSAAVQWRGPNNSMVMGDGTVITINSTPVTLTTALESDTLIDLDPPATGSGRVYRIHGTVIAENPSAPDRCVWDIDVVIQADSSPSTATILSGSVPIVLHESTVGQYSITLTGVTGSRTGLQIQVTRNSGSGSSNLSGLLYIVPGRIQ